MKLLTTITAASLLAVSSAAYSQLNIMKFNGACGSQAVFADTIASYEEIPIARGVSNRSLDGLPNRPLVIFVNITTRTFTIAEKVADDVYCVVGLGIEFEPLGEDGNPVDSVKENPV